ncbi:hypothetical protein [Aurantiacibacter spongiae]|nr:hypothetical protein [Aurantiacibacter spongiae]
MIATRQRGQTREPAYVNAPARTLASELPRRTGEPEPRRRWLFGRKDR